MASPLTNGLQWSSALCWSCGTPLIESASLTSDVRLAVEMRAVPGSPIPAESNVYLWITFLVVRLCTSIPCTKCIVTVKGGLHVDLSLTRCVNLVYCFRRPGHVFPWPCIFDLSSAFPMSCATELCKSAPDVHSAYGNNDSPRHAVRAHGYCRPRLRK